MGVTGVYDYQLGFVKRFVPRHVTESRVIMTKRLLKTFNNRVNSGQIQPDAAQTSTAERLDALSLSLKSWRAPKSGLFATIFGSKLPAPRGIYIHGKVGRGKTMLMDMFYECTNYKPKWRVHFHGFMSEVHDLIGQARNTVDGDPIPWVAERIARKARLLCFDEFHVTDIADAMILGRLFASLFEQQVVVVATSNVSPDGLYRNGLNRALFLPFIALIEKHMEVLELVSAKDFRLEKLSGQPLYFTPVNEVTEAALRAAFKKLTGQDKGVPRSVEVKGRKLVIAEAAEGVAYVTFDAMCVQPLGALDYLQIAEGFHTLILSGVPILTPQRRAEARRFTALIDTLYDQQVCLILSAEAAPDQLHPAGDEAFLFERTASRLIEMRSAAYLDARKQPGQTPAAISAQL
jgi:cell division protein ZapE